MMWAIVKFKKHGNHQWSNAPEKVKELRELHEHDFIIEVWIQQFHHNRDIEYILFRKDLEKIWESVYKKLGEERSCEMLAKGIKEVLRLKFINRRVKVGVFEDETQGALFE